MKSNSLKIVIIVASIIGVLAIVGIIALVVLTTKPSESQVIDLNEEGQFSNNDIDTRDDDSDEETSGDNDNDEEDDNIENRMQDADVQAFNNMFTSYEGDRVRGTQVNALLEIIRKNNEQNENHQVRAMANVQNWDKDNNKADENSYYDLDFEKDDATGFINIVKIEDAE